MVQASEAAHLWDAHFARRLCLRSEASHILSSLGQLPCLWAPRMVCGHPVGAIYPRIRKDALHRRAAWPQANQQNSLGPGRLLASRLRISQSGMFASMNWRILSSLPANARLASKYATTYSMVDLGLLSRSELYRIVPLRIVQLAARVLILRTVNETYLPFAPWMRQPLVRILLDDFADSVLPPSIEQTDRICRFCNVHDDRPGGHFHIFFASNLDADLPEFVQIL